ncbi:MAG: DinB family protein, partial [Bacteroidia bacterium]|nr:DinB family protein [Bacteroidia bacterium]
IDLHQLISTIAEDELLAVVDPETKDPNCKSIQAILTHVVRAGYWYVIEIRKSMGESIAFEPVTLYNSPEQYQIELKEMFKFNERLFEDYPDINLEAHDHDEKIKVKWGQIYDVEQLFEHAIVHVLRHRRQIERFLLKLR